MGYQQDLKVESGHSESLYGYRTGIGGGGAPSFHKNVCDIPVTAFDPFDFEIDWRVKHVKTRKKKVLKSKRITYYTTYVPTPFPYFVFVKKTRTIREWRLEIKAGETVLANVPSRFDLKDIKLRLKWIKDRLKKFGPCRAALPRSPRIQHPCVHATTTTIGIVPNGTITGLVSTFDLVTNDQYGYRAFELLYEPAYAGANSTGPNSALNTLFNQKVLTDPLAVVNDSNTIQTVTAMLWPDSGELEDIAVTPLIDVAEAISDGVFPLGPPPNAVEAHDRMVKKALSKEILGTMREVIDFAADSYLWTTLVLEPVIGAAVGLSTAVEANDRAIDAFKSKAESNKWIQGQSVRLFGKDPKQAANCFGAPTSLTHQKIFGGSVGNLVHAMDYKKFECNASFNYKLSEFDAAAMNTSGQRLGQFFNRLSTSLDDVLHNITPLSFVYDWFSSEYSGFLDLKNKVFLPLADWNLVVSYNLSVDIQSDANTNVLETSYKRRLHNLTLGKIYQWDPVTYLSHGPDQTGFYPYDHFRYDMVLEFYDMVRHTEEHKTRTSETHEYYERSVYDKPIRRTDFSSGELGISCFDTSKLDDITDLGVSKGVTLAALLWGYDHF